MKKLTKLEDKTNEEKLQVKSENPGDWVLYKNNQLIAFNKPNSLPAQSDKTGDSSLQEIAAAYCKHPVHLVHRLDRPASGVVLIAKTPRALVEINKQFQDRLVRKTYLVITGNKPPEKEATLVHYLKKDGQRNQSVVVESEKEGKEARLKYKLLCESDRFFLLEIELITGRHHQIRAQLGAIGCPVRGDDKYGFKRGNKDRSIDLHAWKLGIKHPVTKADILIEAPLPKTKLWAFFKDKI